MGSSSDAGLVLTAHPSAPGDPDAFVAELGSFLKAEILRIVQPCGLGPRKASAIRQLSALLLQRHEGQVPASLEALEALPGVGHKTASVVMAQAFSIPAFPVDTHIHRCAKRWGLSSGKNVKETEKDLKALFPKNSWRKLHLQIIYFGRTFCMARAHKVSECPICSQL